MVIAAFPPVGDADEDGLLAVGGDLEIPSLLLAYRNGIFPWPLNARLLAWFAPPERGVLFFDRFHVPRSLRRERARSSLEFRIDTAFEEVIAACATVPRARGPAGTWITPAMVRAYTALHRAGHAHSFEAWADGELVGGMYGVSINGMFAGESMFFTRSGASKLTLWFAVEHLMSRGATWLDCQMVTPVLGVLGAEEIPRAEFLELLQRALTREISLFP